MNEDIIPQKRCKKCGKTKPINEFHQERISSDGYRHTCKVCRKEAKNLPRLYIPIGMKKCSKCHTILPQTAEYFTRTTGNSSGLRSRCRDCSLEDQGYVPHSKREVIPQGHKRCSRCKQIKPHEDFHKTQREKMGITSDCKICRRRCARLRIDATRKYRRQYRLDNSHTLKTNEARRRARLAELPATLTPQEWRYALDYFNGCCAVCGRQLKDLLSTHTAAADHWIPLSKRGGTTADNIIPLCHGVGGCNNSKHDKNPIDWLTEKYGKRKTNQIMRRIQAYFDSLKE